MHVRAITPPTLPETRKLHCLIYPSAMVPIYLVILPTIDKALQDGPNGHISTIYCHRLTQDEVASSWPS